MFPPSANATLSNQVLKWSGDELYNANVATKSVTPEEANNVVPGEDSGTYSVIQWRNDTFENVDGLFTKASDFNQFKTSATTQSYVDLNFVTKDEASTIASSITGKADQQYVVDELNAKADAPVVDFANTASGHYLRWTATGFKAEEFKPAITTPAGQTEDGFILRWTGSAFENAAVSTVQVSDESANNVVPQTKTSNNVTVQWD